MEYEIKKLKTIKIVCGFVFLFSILLGAWYALSSPKCIGVSGERMGCGLISIVIGGRIALAGFLIACVGSRLADRKLRIINGQEVGFSASKSLARRLARAILAFIFAFFLWYILLLLTNGVYSDFISFLIVGADTVISIVVTLLLFC